MKRNSTIGLIIILAIIGLAVYMSMPSTKSLFGRSNVIKQGLDLKGGVRLVYELDLTNTKAEDKASAIRSTKDVIERRVNTTGVAEPSIQASTANGKDTMIVELPGLTNVDEAVSLIGKTAQLEFMEQGSDTSVDPSLKTSWIPTGLSGKQLKKATEQFEPNTNDPQVGLTFNDEGKKLFGEITSRNINKQVAIFLDDQVLSAPTVQSKITGGEATISGDFTIKEVKNMVNLLNAGALEVPVKLAEQRVIGATLGNESVKQSLTAGVIGLILVALFMVLNYRIAGLVALLGLASYTFITIAFFKFIPVTLTLSGMAGFILSIGMAVDANILIFERMREELKSGRAILLAIDDGFKRAWPSIKDSNIATLITCGVLYFTTTGSIKGFALTLALGVGVSMFTAITASRNFLKIATNIDFLKRGLEKI